MTWRESLERECVALEELFLYSFLSFLSAYVGGATLSFEGSLVVFLHEVLRVDRLTGVKPTLGCSGTLKDKQSELFCCCGTEFDI